ncbi:hypothetical protein L6R53_32250 [Myxococcota bacterium]|nr:hypothetical protein [Myxococcota bacterium]
MPGLPPAWSAALALAQGSVRAGDVEGLRRARQQARQARIGVFLAMGGRGQERPAWTAGMRLARRVALRKAERQRRFLRRSARVAAARTAPARTGPDPERTLRRLAVTGRLYARQPTAEVDPPRASLAAEPATSRPRPDGFGAIAFGTACLSGLNGAKVDFFHEDKVGQSLRTLDDLSELGVTILRHPNQTVLDLTLAALFREDPLPDMEGVVTRLSEKKEGLLAFLRALVERGLMVVFTIGVHGTAAGRDPLTGVGADLTADGRVATPIRTMWAKYAAYPDLDLPESYIDIRDTSPHHAWMLTYTEAVCSLLLELEAAIAESTPGFVLADVVYGVELNNEIDLANTVLGTPHLYGETAWLASAQDWATLLVEMARIVEAAFPNGALRILLPGISSWDQSEDDTDQDSRGYRQTWSWKISFFRALVSNFAALAGDTRNRLVHGVDLHWYHRMRESPGSVVGPQHVSRLSWEIEQVYAALAQAGLDIDVTMFETGISVLKYGEDETYDFFPGEMTDRGDVPALQLYQAQEVLRRQAGAAAGGATVAGWHTWRADTPKPDDHAVKKWYGLGLRKDKQGTGFDEAHPRMSWLALQRYHSILPSWSSARLLLPTEEFRPVMRYSAGGITFPTESPAFLDGVVIEYRHIRLTSLSSTSYAWLVLLDKWRDTSVVSLRCVPIGGTMLTVHKVGLVPLSYSWDVASSDSTLPAVIRTIYRDAREVIVPATGMTWRLDIDSDPFLLVSNGGLTWSYVS